MKTLYTIFCSVALIVSAEAQQYSGKFSHKPELQEFDHFIVMRHQEEAKGDLTVKAFTSWGDLWHSKAERARQSDVRQLKQNLGKKVDIKNVYNLDFVSNGENWSYYMVKYRKDRNNDYLYMIVEEAFHKMDEVYPVEVHSFVWDNATASTNN